MDLNIETEYLKDQPDALVLKERANVFLTDAFKQGLFEVQDANSQLVAAFLDVNRNARWWTLVPVPVEKPCTLPP